MLKIDIQNIGELSPRQNHLKEFNVAFGESDTEKIVSMMTEDAEWDLIGDKKYKGRAEIRSILETMKLSRATSLIITTIICQGNTCAVNGALVFEDSSVAFCDMYVFENDDPESKIKKLTSYGISL